MTVILGETAAETFDARDAGLVFARVASFLDGVAVAWDPALTDLGGGWYRYAYAPAAVGTHEWAGRDAGGTGLAINFDVAAADGSVVVAVRTPSILAGPPLTLVPGDDYLAADGRALGPFGEPPGVPWPTDLTGAVVAFEARVPEVAGWRFVGYGSVLVPTGAAQAVQVELHRRDTEGFAPGVGGWRLRSRAADGTFAALAFGPLTFAAFGAGPVTALV